MTRKYSLVVESGPTGFSGYVPELPSILVTGSSADEVTTRATEAIQVYWEVLRAERSPTAETREIEVELTIRHSGGVKPTGSRSPDWSRYEAFSIRAGSE